MGLQHVALEVRSADAEAELAFWALVGLGEVDVPEGLRGASRWAQAADGTQIHLLLSDDPQVPPEGHAALVPAGDYDAVLAALRAAGHEVRSRAEHWGVPRSFARTPAGHRVELMAAAPPA